MNAENELSNWVSNEINNAEANIKAGKYEKAYSILARYIKTYPEHERILNLVQGLAVASPAHYPLLQALLADVGYTDWLKKDDSNDDRLCDVFVIMPFREELDDIYHQVLVPVCEKLGLRAMRGDGLNDRSHNIIEAMWQAIRTSRLIIADTSHVHDSPNANVYYELGIAHTVDNEKVIIITQNRDEQIPIDLKLIPYIRYDNSAEGRILLMQRVENTMLIRLKELQHSGKLNK